MILGRMTMGTGTGAAGGQARSMGLIATAVRDLHPGYFAFVMATGIISTGTFLLGPSWLSRALLIAASAGLVVLSAALLARLAIFRSSVAAALRAPGARRARGPSAAHGDPGQRRCCGVARADVRGTCQPAARAGARLGPRRRQRRPAAVGGRPAVPRGRGLRPGSRMALASRAASAGRYRAVERRAGAVPAACLTDPVAVADSGHDAGHARSPLLDPYGRHGDHRPGRCPDPEPPRRAPCCPGDCRIRRGILLCS